MTNPPDNQPPQNPYAGRYGANPPEDQSPHNPYAGRYGENPPGYQPGQPQPSAQQPPQPQYQQPQYEGGLPSAPPVGQEYRSQPAPISPDNFRVSDAVRFGWSATKSFFGTWIIAMILVGGLSLGIIYATNRMIRDIVQVYRDLIDAGVDVDPDVIDRALAAIPGLSGTEILLAIFGTVVVGVLWAGVSNMGLRAARGARPTLGDLVALPNFTKVFITVALLQIVATVSGLLPGVGPLLQIIVTFLTMFAVYFALDRGLDAASSIGASLRLVGNSFGFVIVLLLASAGLAILGGIALVIGLLVTLPIIVGATAISYVVLSQKTPQR